MKKKEPEKYEDPLFELDPANDAKYLKFLDKSLGDDLTLEQKKAVIDFVKLQCQLAVHSVSKEEQKK